MSTNIKLIIRDGGPGLHFTYSTKSGRRHIFRREPGTEVKVCRIPIEEWRANRYAVAKDLFEQPLNPYIIPDFEIEVAEATEPQSPDAALLKEIEDLKFENESLRLKLELAQETAEKAAPTPAPASTEPEAATKPLTDEELAERIAEAEQEIPGGAEVDPTTIPEPPPADNAHVEPGTELFTEQSAPSETPERNEPPAPAEETPAAPTEPADPKPKKQLRKRS